MNDPKPMTDERLAQLEDAQLSDAFSPGVAQMIWETCREIRRLRERERRYVAAIEMGIRRFASLANRDDEQMAKLGERGLRNALEATDG